MIYKHHFLHQVFECISKFGTEPKGQCNFEPFLNGTLTHIDNHNLDCNSWLSIMFHFYNEFLTNTLAVAEEAEPLYKMLYEVLLDKPKQEDADLNKDMEVYKLGDFDLVQFCSDVLKGKKDVSRS